MITREKARRLPGSVSTALQERLIQQSMRHWEQCATDYFRDVVMAVCSYISKLCRDQFGRYEKSGLYSIVE